MIEDSDENTSHHNFYESSFIMKTENEFPIFLNLFKKLLASAKIAKELIGMRVYNKIYTHDS